MIRFEIFYSGKKRPSWKYRTVADNGKTLNYAHGFNTAELARESVRLITDNMIEGSFTIFIAHRQKK